METYPAGGTAVATQPRTNKLAVVALVLSIVSVALPGLIGGVIALRQIDRSVVPVKGRGAATAAIVIGALWLFLLCVIYGLALANANSGY